jgi:solute carrier family 25 (mitochondrial phosphate transporter), member 23/24/25/41
MFRLVLLACSRECCSCVLLFLGVDYPTFSYAAIDMSTFEALKLAYLRSTGKDEPGVLALLAFGSVSGSVGATTVYPLNLVRTRLQASGSSGHPQKYTGIADVVVQTYQRDGWRGFYRGLFPTLAKVC